MLINPILWGKSIARAPFCLYPVGESRAWVPVSDKIVMHIYLIVSGYGCTNSVRRAYQLNPIKKCKAVKIQRLNAMGTNLAFAQECDWQIEKTEAEQNV